ncbi:MAG TPA: cardiolipin synthase [Gammaproteobacteria bacterium]|nr:cardiolipin synthase [Gammaproteobacteria bacterium]HIL97964.1 cardiolipin synthase [Pseudomonadales bacterium]
MIVTLVLVFEVVGILSAVHAVMSVRTPQESIAWAVSLVSLPYISVPAYWVFGRNKFQDYVLARQHELEQLAEVVSEARINMKDVELAEDKDTGLLTSAEKMARIPMTHGNKVDLLIDGQATFDSIFEGISSATDYVLIQFYIVRDDELGLELKRHLITKAQSGVRVLFLYDEVGSLGLSAAYRQELRDAGVEIFPFHSRRGSGNRFQLNFRNHRKTVIVDGRVAWIGGHNVGDEYMGRDASFGHWRDTHMRIEGPAVIGAQFAFVEDWRWATDAVPGGINWNPQRVPDHDAQVLVIASGPADPMETASLMYTQAINAATKRIWIASPYFVPDDSIVQALQLAGLRGVDVRILIPEKSDNLLVTLAAYSFFTEIKAAGVKFYRYQHGFLHQKVMLIDADVATVGTANFDNRSFRLNFEITSLVADTDFVLAVEQMFEADFAESRRMERDEYDNKPYWFKLAVRSARLAAPIL